MRNYGKKRKIQYFEGLWALIRPMGHIFSVKKGLIIKNTG